MATTPPIGWPRNTNAPEIQEQLGFNPLAAPNQPPPVQDPQPNQGQQGQPPAPIGDQISLDPEQGAPVNSVPALDSWDDPSGNAGGVDARNLNFAQQQPTNGQSNGNPQGPQASQPFHRVPASGSPFGGANRGMLNGTGLPGGATNLNTNSSAPLSSPFAASPGATPMSGNSASPFQPQSNETEFSVRRDDDGRQRLQDSDRNQRKAQEQFQKNAASSLEFGRNMGEQASQHGQAQQGFQDSALQNMNSGNQNLQLAGQNTQAGQQSNQQGLLQQLLAQAQKKVQEMEKAIEAKGKAVEQKGVAIEGQGQGIESSGHSLEGTGHTTEGTGHTTEGTGVGMQTAGEGLIAAGAALIGGLFTAPAGAALVAQGGLMTAGGIGLQVVGKGLQATGKGMQAQGKGLQSVGKQTQQTGKQTQQSGKQQQAQAKENQQKAKEKENKHNDLFKKLIEEAKKFMEAATKNKQDAGKNFKDADKDKEKSKEEGKNRDQSVDKANDANKQATQNQKRADKAKDNQRVLDEAIKKAWGPRQEQSRRGEGQQELDSNGATADRPGSANSPNSSQSGSSGNSARKTDRDENAQRFGPVANSRGPNRRHAVHRPGESQGKADSRREGDERVNPMAHSQGQDHDQQGGQHQNGQGAPHSTDAVSGANPRDSQQPSIQSPAQPQPQPQPQQSAPAPSSGPGREPQPQGTDQLPAAGAQPGQTGQQPQQTQATAPERETNPVPQAASTTPGSEERSGPNQTAPGRGRTASVVANQGRSRNNGLGGEDSSRQGGQQSPARGAAPDQAGSTNDGGSDKQIEPAAKPESEKGTASFETTDENVSVKLNDLNSDGEGSGGEPRAAEGLITS